MNSPCFGFILANGLTNGGVTTWAVNTSRRMVAKGQSCAIVAHDIQPGSDEFPRGNQDWIVDCPGNASGDLPKPKEIDTFSRCYAALGDAILLPNWSWGTWAGVAAMMRHPRQQNRVVGIAHTDEKSYYDIMVHYEPIISKYIAVSDQTYKNLIQLLPGRQHDIIRLPYPVARRDSKVRSSKQRNILRMAMLEESSNTKNVSLISRRLLRSCLNVVVSIALKLLVTVPTSKSCGIFSNMSIFIM